MIILFKVLVVFLSHSLLWIIEYKICSPEVLKIQSAMGSFFPSLLCVERLAEDNDVITFKKSTAGRFLAQILYPHAQKRLLTHGDTRTYRLKADAQESGEQTRLRAVDKDITVNPTRSLRIIRVDDKTRVPIHGTKCFLFKN